MVLRGMQERTGPPLAVFAEVWYNNLKRFLTEAAGDFIPLGILANPV